MEETCLRFLGSLRSQRAHIGSTACRSTTKGWLPRTAREPWADSNGHCLKKQINHKVHFNLFVCLFVCLSVSLLVCTSVCL
jgi:hypothetical protein